jgi:two-component system KDP operon response regulator KdpE
MTSQTVLVIDDNPITRKLVRITLGREGYLVVEADCGRSALEAMMQYTPDLVLQDLILPDIGGTELVRQLRALPSGANIPILAISGFGSMLAVAEKRRMGFTDFMFKPVEPSRLVAAVRSHLSEAPSPPAAQTFSGAAQPLSELR